MTRLIKLMALAALMPILAACGASSSVVQVTSIPTMDATATLAPTNTTVPPTAIVVVETEEVASSGYDFFGGEESVFVASNKTVDEEAPATSTPLSINLAPGEARAIAMATDAIMEPTPRDRLTFDEAVVSLNFDEFYDGFSIREGLVLSDKLVSLDGQTIQMEGYMAPPLKPALDWFVLTRTPLALCPFCSTDADWPNDIALVYMPDGETALTTTRPLEVTGRIEIGSSVDPETGMISLVRIYAENFEVAG